MTTRLLSRRIIEPLLDLLRQGITAEKIAMSIAIGAVLGVFPVLGSTTLLCLLAALLFRLNLPAIQLVNYLIYPLQLALLLPFIRLGEQVFKDRPLGLSIGQIQELIRVSPWHAIVALWTSTLHAIVAWAFVAPFAVLVLYGLLLVGLRRLSGLRGVRRTAGSIIREVS